MEPLTVEDYRMMPETGPRYQLIEGELLWPPHRLAITRIFPGNISLLLAEYLEKHLIGKLYVAPAEFDRRWGGRPFPHCSSGPAPLWTAAVLCRSGNVHHESKAAEELPQSKAL